MSERRYINLPNRRLTLPFNDAVLVGDTLYISGRLGLGPDGKIASEPEEEARLILEGFKSVLHEAGMTLDDMVSVQIYCSDVSLFDKWNAVYVKYFTGSLPSRAFLGSGPLLFGARFEMVGIAVKR